MKEAYENYAIPTHAEARKALKLEDLMKSPVKRMQEMEAQQAHDRQ